MACGSHHGDAAPTFGHSTVRTVLLAIQCVLLDEHASVEAEAADDNQLQIGLLSEQVARRRKASTLRANLC